LDTTDERKSRLIAEFVRELEESGDSDQGLDGPRSKQLREQLEIERNFRRTSSAVRERAQRVQEQTADLYELFDAALQRRGVSWDDLVAQLGLDSRRARRFQSGHDTLLSLSPDRLAQVAKKLDIAAERIILAAAKGLWSSRTTPLAYRSLPGRTEQSLAQQDQREQYLLQLWAALRNESA